MIVDLGVAEEPEQVLEQHRIAAAGRIEEGGAEIAVGDQHGDGTRQHRDRQQQQERRHQHRPDEQRHAVQGHARGAHVEDRGDEVDRAEQGADAGQMQGEQRAVHADPRLERGVGQRRIQRPAGARFAQQQAGQDQHEGRRQQPEADVIQARERHVRRADHQRDEPVAEAADQRWHDREEDHDQAVRRDDGVPFLARGDDGPAGMLELGAHDDRQQQPDQAGADREDQIEGADILVVRAEQPALREAGIMPVLLMIAMAVGIVMRGGRHVFFSFLGGPALARHAGHGDGSL
jgi:hypothetical protein